VLAGDLLWKQPVISKPKRHRKKVVKRRKSSGKPHARDDGKLYADIMTIVENNGHVTLPQMPFFENLLTNRRIRAIGFLLVSVGLIALLKLAHRTA
jgi:hypothetical protein